MIHTLKIKESFADAVLSGDKTFEVRENDRGFQKGDMVKFTVVNDGAVSTPLEHELNHKVYEITYVLSGWGIQEGYVVFGIKYSSEDTMINPDTGKGKASVVKETDKTGYCAFHNDIG